MNVTFTELSLPSQGTILLLVPQNGSLCQLGNQLDDVTQGALSRALASSQFTGQSQSWVELLAPANTELERVIIVGVGDGSPLVVEESAGELMQQLKQPLGSAVYLVTTDMTQAVHFVFGCQLGLYRFDKYRTHAEFSKLPIIEELTVGCTDVVAAQQMYAPLAAAAHGITITRDLVWEPANVLTTESFSAYCQTLNRFGLEVEVVSSAKMQELGMGALLGVGQGSKYESQVVVLKYQGRDDQSAPIAFLGKGVVFDSGGLSLKSNASMNTMKEDMGGAGTVTGLMVTLAQRKANVNAIGVLGLVENMPSAEAQRPSDVVTTMSGQTVEVMSTDAEGRLVLCDLLTYTQRFYQPKAMIDLATLTSAIIMALGEDIAGIFSNNDQLAIAISEAGVLEGEPVWRMPLGESFKRLITSHIADMRNNGNKIGIGGSGVAAQFLYSFIENDTPWVHIDIAGTAWTDESKPTRPKGATGFGVRLLDRLVKEHFED
ncbi:leucyl aminopeptidase [Celerinatantimonas yamalensis]|uniref:Probable cytosol aminopeptidase n=1 Tax=Celerinatantimonas yamalensis TaxID=559956 RepID=A0ABW9G9Z5_9GAMM